MLTYFVGPWRYENIVLAYFVGSWRLENSFEIPLWRHKHRAQLSLNSAKVDVSILNILYCTLLFVFVISKLHSLFTLLQRPALILKALCVGSLKLQSEGSSPVQEKVPALLSPHGGEGSYRC